MTVSGETTLRAMPWRSELQASEKARAMSDGVGELPALGATALDLDRFAPAGPIDEEAKDRIGTKAGAIGGAQTKRQDGDPVKMIGREQDLLTGQLGDAVGMVGLARVVFVDGFVNRGSVNLPGRRVDDSGAVLRRRPRRRWPSR